MSAGNTDSRILPMAKVEKQAIMNAITRLNGDKLMAAKLLGSERPLYIGN
jgi:hypothetical protein